MWLFYKLGFVLLFVGWEEQEAILRLTFSVQALSCTPQICILLLFWGKTVLLWTFPYAFSWWQSSSVCRWKGQMLVMKWDFLLLWLQCNVSEIQIRVSHQSFLILPSISQWGVIPSRELEALNKILHLWYLGGFFIFLYVSWIFWWEIEGWLTGPSCLVAVTSRSLSPLSSWIFPIPL